MTASQIEYVYIISHAGAVVRRVIVAEDAESLQFTNCHLRNIRHKVVGDTVGVLSDESALVRSDWVEISEQGDIKGIIGFVYIFEYSLDIQLGPSVIIGSRDVSYKHLRANET